MGKTNAGAITKVLKANGFTHAQWNKVGVSTYNDGFISESTYGESVVVDWMFAGHHREITADELATTKQHLAKMASVLEARGYEVKLMGDDYPWLSVKRPV